MSDIGAFYLAPALWREPFHLAGAEHTHLMKVLRARPGDVIRLLDGQGREGRFVITDLDRQRATLRPEEIISHLPVAQSHLPVAQSLKKNLKL